MRLKDFDYDLPQELIAQAPCPERDQSRMMVIHRKEERITHHVFYQLPAFLQRGDVLVINDSKVIPGRLKGSKETGGHIEILLLSKQGDGSLWEVLLRPAKRVHLGMRVRFGQMGEARIIDRITDKKWMIQFSTFMPFDDFLEQVGIAPLPPYIKRKGRDLESVADRERYQTVYARVSGSVAAPTAGLHFTKATLRALEEEGVLIARVTLHVGYGTFLPVTTDVVEDHDMDEESFAITPDAAEMINGARRVVAVGTTSTRVIEAVADESGRVREASGFTKLFIYPGYRFKRVDALLTNFHLPRSSLFLLVCAFAGSALMQKAYRKAMDNQYRFYSYGDCMLIL